tara:strand:- start:2268 stop:2666 length:399 start_codon:yes stop_codon:yes gene_type:complete
MEKKEQKKKEIKKKEIKKNKFVILLKNSPINEKSSKSGNKNPCPEGQIISHKTGKCIKNIAEPKKKIFTPEENKYFKATYKNKVPTEKQIHYIKTVVAYNKRIERLEKLGTENAFKQIKKEEKEHKAFLKNL